MSTTSSLGTTKVGMIGALFGGGIFLLICYLLGCFKSSESKPEISALAKDNFISTVKMNNSVMDATITDVGYLYIAVLNLGIDRNAMAVYHCRLAKEKGVPLEAVKIVDYSTFEKGDGWATGKELGISQCD